MISRKVIVWSIAVISLAIALFVWLAVVGPSNLPVIIAEPVQPGTEPKVLDDDTAQPTRFTVRNPRAENPGELGEAVTALVTSSSTSHRPMLTAPHLADHNPSLSGAMNQSQATSR